MVDGSWSFSNIVSMENPAEPVRLSGEHDLIVRLRAGEAGAFETVYLAYYQRLWEYAYRYVRDEGTAEDVVHDVFRMILERCASLRIEQGVEAYLYGAVRHRVLQLLRHEGVVRHMAEESGDEVPALGAQEEATDAAVLEHDLDARVQYYLRRLPERTQTLFILRWKHGMTYPEIAAALGMSPEAAKKLGQRVQVAFRRLVEELRD